MKAKVLKIMSTNDAHHRVAVKLDKSCGISQITITEGKGGYLIGIHPGGKVRKYNKDQLKELLEENAFYIQSWRAL